MGQMESGALIDWLRHQTLINAVSQRSISFDVFCSSTEDSIQWYDWLPGDVRVEHIPSAPSLAESISRLMQASQTATGDVLDIIAAHCLNGLDNNISSDQWRVCSEQSSRIMAANLTASGSRSLRMRAQRLHYYIQDQIAEKTPIRANDLLQHESIMGVTKPWDFLSHASGIWSISCDTTNIHHRDNQGVLHHYTRGLPTQLDGLNEDFVCIGSLYSNGCTITNGHIWREISHTAPVLLIWETSDGCYFVDYLAAIWQETPRQKIAQLPCAQLHFSRYHNGKLYGLNNGEFGCIWIYDMHTGNITHQSVMPVWVANDVAFADPYFYLIDKQQGYVFKFDQNWIFKEKVLAFGRGQGRLLDPVSIRVVDNSLHVISWINAKHTTLKLF